MAATLTPEAQDELEKYIGQLLDLWEVPVQVRIGLTGGGGVKLPEVTRIRTLLVKQLRRSCWQDHVKCPQRFLHGRISNPGPQWHPLSLPNIGFLLGLTHTGVLRALERKAKTVDTVST